MLYGKYIIMSLETYSNYLLLLTDIVFHIERYVNWIFVKGFTREYKLDCYMDKNGPSMKVKFTLSVLGKKIKI